jgi:hypothetical protein
MHCLLPSSSVVTRFVVYIVDAHKRPVINEKSQKTHVDPFILFDLEYSSPLLLFILISLELPLLGH